MLPLSCRHFRSDGYRIEPRRHYSRPIKFIDEIARNEPEIASTSVDIFSHDEIEWYCQVCRGEQKTQPMGPYTKRQAERVQDARRSRIAAKGTGWLVFEKTAADEDDEKQRAVVQ